MEPLPWTQPQHMAGSAKALAAGCTIVLKLVERHFGELAALDTLDMGAPISRHVEQ